MFVPIVDNFASFLYHIAAFGSLSIADCVDSSFAHVQSSLFLSKIAKKNVLFLIFETPKILWKSIRKSIVVIWSVFKFFPDSVDPCLLFGLPPGFVISFVQPRQ